jgi:hypothetical protein
MGLGLRLKGPLLPRATKFGSGCDALPGLRGGLCNRSRVG